MCGAAEELAFGETREQVQAVLGKIGASWEQLERWRAQGILPPVDWAPQAYRGSTVRYPVGTCAQIEEIVRLLKEKKRTEYVAIRLWRAGYWVAERVWRPRLRAIAKWDLLFRRVVRMRLAREAKDELSSDTWTDRAARRPVRNLIISRVLGRLVGHNNGRAPEYTGLSIFYRVMADISQGQFAGFEPADGNARTDKQVAEQALDLGYPDSHSILGNRMNHSEVIEDAFKNVSDAFELWSLADAARAPEAEIRAAAVDARHAFEMMTHFYEAAVWIWGDRAFGYRFAAWFTKKASDPLIDLVTLTFVLLRRVPGAMISSQEIARTAAAALELKMASEAMRHLANMDPRFADVFSPKRIRRAFSDRVEMSRWRGEIETAKNGTQTR